MYVIGYGKIYCDYKLILKLNKDHNIIIGQPPKKNGRCYIIISKIKINTW